MLEQILYQPRVQQEPQRVYQIVNLRGLSAFELYNSGPVSGFTFPSSGFQFRFHERGSGPITGGKISTFDRKLEIPLNNYQIAMGDLYAKALKIKPISFDKDE